MNLTLPDVTMDQWADGRTASRETHDMLRLHPRPHLPNSTQLLSDANCLPVAQETSHHQSPPGCDENPLSVLAYAGRLVDRGAGHRG